MQQDMVVAISEMLESSGFTNIHVQGKMSFPGNANHEMGTARMGRDHKTSVLNGFNQMHEVKNVFITMAHSWCQQAPSILHSPIWQ